MENATIMMTDILSYLPEKVKIPKSENVKLSTAINALRRTKEGEMRLEICLKNDVDEIKQIANLAKYNDFRMIATSKLVLKKMKSVNWLKTKPRKILRVIETPMESIGVDIYIFSTWIDEILAKVLSEKQLIYLIEKKSRWKDSFQHELKNREMGI
jgi:hypothetical protein